MTSTNDDPGTRSEGIISTGNTDIDAKLGGGIPVGSLTLIEGQSASGKSVLAQQFTWGSLWANQRVVHYTTERTVKGLVKQMESLGLPVMDFLLLRALRVYPINAAVGVDATAILEALIQDIQRHEDLDLVVIDSLSPMVTPNSIVNVISFFDRCRALCSMGKTIVATLHTYSSDPESRDRMRSLCDANLNLRVNNVGDQLVHVLEVTKVSGATSNTGNVLSFAIEPMIGLRIIPVSWAKV